MRFAHFLILPVIVLSISACSSDDDSNRTQPADTPTGTLTAVATATPTPSLAASSTATASPTVPPTATPTDGSTSTPTGTATPTVDAELRCEDAAAASLAACIDSVNAAQRSCYLDAGRACAVDDAEVSAAIAALGTDVRAACLDDATVAGVGYGPLFTPDSLAERLAESCRSEAASLASRTFGGPQGVVVGTTNAEVRGCLTAAHDGGSQLLRDVLALNTACVQGEKSGDGCAAEQAESEAAALEGALVTEIGTACDSLQDLIAIDAATYAARAAVQARCLTAAAHPDPSPLELDCGPRDGLVDLPRGEYVQVVLDEEVWGTRCGDGSPFAFWIRLAPEGEPVERVIVGLQGGGVCIFAEDCASRPADLFESLEDDPEMSGPLSNDPEVNPFAAWTKVYLPYCNQDVFIGGGTTSTFQPVPVHRFGAINVRAAMRYVRDVVWRELDQTTEEGYRPDRMRVFFGGFSAGAFGTLYNYHYLLDDLQWAHTTAYPDAGLALDNGEPLSVATLGVLLFSDTPPLGWGARNYVPPYCKATNCGVGPVLLAATAPRLKAVPDQQFLILSNQVDETQVDTTFFPDTPTWINAVRDSYCATRNLPGVHYFLPAISENVHVISPREQLYTMEAIGGEVMRDWLFGGFEAPDDVADRAEEGTLVDDYPGVLPFDCPVSD